MKTVYIPKGETVHYESLTTEHLVVHGRLHVTYGVKAQSITGRGEIDASSINADTVCIDDEDTRTHKVFRALDEICDAWNLAKPIWLDTNISEFKRRSKTRFTQDNFIESLEFDYLEIQITEE